MTTDIETKIKNIITRIRPYIQRDGGDIEYVRFEDGIVFVRLTGACVGCQFSDVTLYQGLESVLVEEVPGVIGVELAD
ncbi:MAG: NifU family protein [Bacilli bacterium]|jgi:Fe-S cluster biogenesis protein NfuA|nr:NifU family protein [Acholeplasmataceae bacterium]